MVNLAKQHISHPDLGEDVIRKFTDLKSELRLIKLEELTKWSSIQDKYSFLAVYHQATINDIDESIKSLDTIIALLSKEDNDN